MLYVETLQDTNNFPKVNSCGLDLDSLAALCRYGDDVLTSKVRAREGDTTR